MKITAIVLATSTVFASTAAFAGDLTAAAVEGEVAVAETMTTTTGAAGSGMPWWLLAVGVVAAGVALSQSN